MIGDLTGWTIVYDLDGTLVDSAPDLHAALNYTLALQDLGPVSLASIRNMIGDGAKALIRKGLTEHAQPVDAEQIDTVLWPAFIDYYRQNASVLSTLFDGALDCLQAFEKDGIVQMVCTNKAEALAAIVLDELGIATHFDAMTGGDTYPYRKPDGRHILSMLEAGNRDPQRAIMIGDSQTDARAAHNAGLPFVFVRFGYGPSPDFGDAIAYTIDAWSDLPDLVTALTNKNT